MFALEGDLRKATETAEAKARSLQESQRALAAVVAKLGGNFNPFFASRGTSYEFLPSLY